MDLTKETGKILCYLYKIYLERRKNGASKSDAKLFDDTFCLLDKKISKLCDGDIDEVLLELSKNEYIKLSIIGQFELTNKTIVFMEGKFKDDINKVIDFLLSIPL